jgi:hypothetical protein
VLLLEPATDLMSVLHDRAREVGVAAVAATAFLELPETFVHIHPYAPSRALRRSRLDKTMVFADFSSANDSRQVAEHIRSLLSEFCRMEDKKRERIFTHPFSDTTHLFLTNYTGPRT